MATRQQRKLKARKRTHHAKSTGYGRLVIGEGEQAVHLPDVYTDVISGFVALGSSASPPTRALCGVCGLSQKVRVNGLLSRHDVFLGADGKPRPGGVHLTKQQCAGSGQHYAGAL